MYQYWIASTLVLIGLCLGASAQDGRKLPPPNPVAISTPHGQKTPIGQELGKKQVDLIRQVNTYFNQLTILKGSSIQTSADNKRQRASSTSCDPDASALSFHRPAKS
jgi:histidinol phosphatase-like PHP family hydrolase